VFEVSEFSPSSERWIFIYCEYYDEIEEYIIFLKEYELLLSGKIFSVSDDCQHGIDNDPLNLIFQWDSCFGITVIVPYKTSLDAAIEVMQNLCNIVNEKIGSTEVYEYYRQNYKK